MGLRVACVPSCCDVIALSIKWSGRYSLSRLRSTEPPPLQAPSAPLRHGQKHEPRPPRPATIRTHGLSCPCLKSPLSKEDQILHLTTSSLAHAAPLLRAAQAAGLRESGIQTLPLRSLDPGSLQESDRDSAPLIQVAVRTVGLGFSSVVGFATAEASGGAEGEGVHACVDEEYIEGMVGVIEGRFRANSGRMERFEDAVGALLRSQEQGREGPGGEGWEEGHVRAARMREEGLARAKAIAGRNGRRVAKDIDWDGDGDEEEALGLSGLALGIG